jgi:tetratricopeptide (TPR) repeat protein
MAETITGTPLDLKVGSVKDDRRSYWLPSARALGKQALPLYYAELNRAVNAYNLGHLDEAEVILDALLKELELILPDHVDSPEGTSFNLLYAGVLTAKGRVCERSNQEKQARGLFKRAVDQFSGWIEPESDLSAQVYCDYGVALFKIGSTKRTIQALEQAREKSALNAEALRYLGICYCQITDFSKANDCFSDSLKLENCYFLTHKALAECLQKQGKISEAIAEYSHVALSLTTSGMFAEAQRITGHMLDLDPKDPTALVRAGETLLASSLPDKALETLDKGLELQTKNAAAIRLKGLALFNLKRYEAAAEQFRHALKLDPTLYKARIKLGSAYYHLGKFSSALAVLDEALMQRPDDPRALVKKANTLVALNNNVEALALLDKALKFSPNNARALRIKGQVLTELREYKKAVQVLEKAVKSDPKEPRAYAALGQALSILAEHDRALEALDKAIAIQPNYAPALVYKGETLRAKGENQEALQVLNQALALTSDAWALGTKGQVLRNLGMYEEAVKTLRESVQLNPSLAWAHGELIATLYRLDRFEETLEALEEALELHPSAEWFVFEGQVLNEIAEFNLANKALDRALDISQDSSQTYGAKGWALENLRDGQGALESYSRAEKLEKKNLYWQIGVANSLYLEEELEKASEKYERIIKQAKLMVGTDAHLEAISLIGWCQYRLGHFKEAIDLFGKVVAGMPDMIIHIFNLALALICKGRNEEGLREYKRALRLAEGKAALPRRGLIFVAYDDLDLAIKMHPQIAKVTEVNEAQSLLRKTLTELPRYKSMSS